jgi:hypothetical protein
MLYRSGPPEPSGKFRELVLLFALVVAVVVAVGAIWVTWDGRWSSPIRHSERSSVCSPYGDLASACGPLRSIT